MRTLEWRSLGGAEYRLEIQDGMDEVRGLVGGASPFVTSTDDDDDFFAAVRTTTGAISVIGDVAEVEELVTGVPADKLVELYAKKSDGTDLGCVWRGFLQTTAYSQAWNKGPLQFSLPVVSPLGVLDSFYPKADVVEKTWSFAEFLVNANKAKEGMLFWDGFVFPASCNPEQTLMYRMQMQNFGTYNEKQERWHVESYMMILQEVCKLFGWACQEWNNKLVFLAADDTTEYLGYRADRLEQKIETGVAIVENIRVETTAETIWGAEHQLDYIDGKKSVEVTGEVNAYEGEFWSLNLSSMEIHSHDEATRTIYLDDTERRSEERTYYTIMYNKGYGIIPKDEPSNFRFENWKNDNDNLSGATIVREILSTRYNGRVEKGEWKNRMLYRGTNMDAGTVLFKINTGHTINSNKLSGKYYIKIKGSVSISTGHDEEFETRDGRIDIRLYIGDSEITSSTRDAFSISPNGDIFNMSSRTTTQANIWIPDDAKGAVRVEIVIPNIGLGDYYYSIDDFSIGLESDTMNQALGEYYKENKISRENKDSGHTSEYNIVTHLTTANSFQAGYGIVLANDVMAEPPVSLNVSGERPEVHLADRLWNYYKQSRKKLTVQLRMDGEGLNPLNLHSFSTAVPLSTGNNSEAVPLSTEIRGMACLAQTIDWAEDTVTAALFEIKN